MSTWGRRMSAGRKSNGRRKGRHWLRSDAEGEIYIHPLSKWEELVNDGRDDLLSDDAAGH